MLSAIVRFALHFRGIVIALAAMTAGYGLYSLTQAKYDVFPEFTPPQAAIRIEAPGFSPEQVESLVTRPVENAIAGVPGIETFTSQSVQGLSAIRVVFKSGSDIYRERQLVAERLASMTQPLPAGVTPFILPLTSSTGTVMQLGMLSKKHSLMQLRTIADWTVKPRLLAAPGVAQVQVYGGELKELQIQIQPERLLKHNLSTGDILTAAAGATGVRGAGFVENQNQRITLQTEGQALTADKLADTVVFNRDGVSLTLGDLTTVKEDAAPSIGAASINGQNGIVLLVTAQYGANTLQVTGQLDKAIRELRPMLNKEGILFYPSLFRPANYIHTALGNVRQALAIGAILVVIVLLIFLFNFRTAAISLIAIPLSLLGAVIVLTHLGMSLNTMTLGGLAVAIGEVVDDAVIDVENILRRLRQNRYLPHPGNPLRVILDASLEVRSAVIFATFAVILVFFPVLTLGGLGGRLFAPTGIAYIAAVLCSLAVALTVTPASSAYLLAGQRLPEKEPTIVLRLKEGYGKLLAHIHTHAKAVLAVVVLFILIGAVIFPFLHSAFLPQMRESDLTVHVSAIPGTSLPEALRLGNRVSLELARLPGVQIVSQKTGRAEEGSSTRDIGASEIDITFNPDQAAEALNSMTKIRTLLSQFPGTTYEVNTFLKERIGETVSGHASSVVINIFSDDFAILDKTGRKITGILQRTPGSTDIKMQAVPGSPQMMIELNRNGLRRWGLSPVDVLDAVRAANQGTVVSQIYPADQFFNVRVILAPKDRRSVLEIGMLPIRSPGGSYIQLKQIADIYEKSGRHTILHDNARRVQTVTCNVQGRSVGSFVTQARSKINSKVALPAGTYIEFAGTAQAAAAASRDLLIHSVMAGVGIVLLLFFVLRNYQNVFLILLNLPFALIGGILILWATRTTLSLGAMVGFITVFGITLRNAIMMISHYEHLVNVEGKSWSPETSILGASERLAPILMTALVTGFGLLPLALGANAPGREMEGHMAIVILGGLLTSTALNLLVLPTLAARYGRFASKNDSGQW